MSKKINQALSLNAHNLEILLGIYAVVRGLLLLNQPRYFYYPPQWVWLMDNSYLDELLTIIGVLLFTFAIFEHGSARYAHVRMQIIRVLLVIMAGYEIGIAVVKMMHGIFLGRVQMGYSALGNIFVFVTIVLTASDA